MSEARHIAELTLRDFLVALASETIPMCDLRLVLVPDEETKARHIEKRIEAGTECECEEHGYPKYSCLDRAVLVCPELPESVLMHSDPDDPRWDDMAESDRATYEAAEGTMPTMLLAGFGNYASLLAEAAAMYLPMHLMSRGVPPMRVGQMQTEEELGIIAPGEALTAEAIDNLDLDELVAKLQGEHGEAS